MSECIVPQNTYFDKDGYAKVKHQGIQKGLHRLMYSWCVGDIPEGMVVAHKCNNPSCVNPSHLYVCSHEQNSSDAARDGLYKSGNENGNWNPKLEEARKNAQQILTMYEVNGFTQRYIGHYFGISQSRVSQILREMKQNER